jgi:GT2 family glycosyltransferase
MGETPIPQHPALAEVGVKVVALLTCHNRQLVTVRCLHSLFDQNLGTPPPGLGAVVVDDGSNDGTAEAIAALFPAARVHTGDGSLFWARGMQTAEALAVEDRPDFLLWLNDDVVLEPSALRSLLSAAALCPDAIVVGALRDPDTGELMYSGVTLSVWHPLRVSRIEPGDRPVEAETFNGNVVLVPRIVYERVGSIDGRFPHAYADFDYGLRARRAGFRVVVAPGNVGTCRRNTDAGTFRDTSLSLGQRWKLVQSPKGLPLRSHARYLRRHGGRLWPVFWLAPYAKLTASALVSAPRRKLSSRS